MATYKTTSELKREQAITRERNAIRDGVWGPPEPYEDQFWSAKWDDVDTVSPSWSWQAMIDWIHRYA